MRSFGVSQKRGFDDRDEHRWKHSSPSRFHDSSRRYDYSKPCEAVPSRIDDRGRDSSRNQFRSPSRDFSRKCDVSFPRSQNPSFKYSRNENFRNGGSVSPRFHARHSEIHRGGCISRRSDVRTNEYSKHDSVSSQFQERPREYRKEGIAVKINEKHDLSRRYDSVSPRFQEILQERPRENPKEGISIKINEKHDLSRRCDSDSPRFQERTSKNRKEGATTEVERRRNYHGKYEATRFQGKTSENDKKDRFEKTKPALGLLSKSVAVFPRVEVKTSENLEEGPSRVQGKNGEVTIKVKPSENLGPGVAAQVKACETYPVVKKSESLTPSFMTSDSTRAVICQDNFKKRKVNVVRQFPKYCGALAPLVTIRRCDNNSKAALEHFFESSETSLSSVANPETTKLKVVTENVEDDDVEKESYEMEDDHVESGRMSSDVAKLLNEPFRSKASKAFVRGESVDSCDGFESNDFGKESRIKIHSFNPKDDVAPSAERIHCQKSFKRKSEENDMQENFYNVQKEYSRFCINVSSDSEDEGRIKMGNSRDSSPEFELSPYVEQYKEDDDEMVNAEHGDDANTNKKGNNPTYSPESSPFKDHDEVSSEDDCYVVPSKYSDLFLSQDKRLNDLKIGPWGNSEATRIRKQVLETLDSFYQIYVELIEKNQAAEAIGKGKVHNQAHKTAARLLREQKKWVNTEKVFGDVPGVEVGDRYQFRAELLCVGLHHKFENGIDYRKENDKLLATSVVHSRRYANGAEYPDVLIYSGQGGNPTVSTKDIFRDQELVKGNRALKNSMDAKTPVRVIRKSRKACERPYFYDGLYIVTKVYKERDCRSGKLVYMFRLERIKSGEAKITLEKKPPRVLEDISHGKEKTLIRVVNNVDDVDFPSFNYMKNMSYPPSCYRYIFGCDCSDGCSDSRNCRCVTKNGGRNPFNDDGAIVISPYSKKYIYECGPSCKCPPSCKNRVSQYGIKYLLEVFKTETKGWGLRSRDFIPSGSFICEYVGELLLDQEEEKRSGNDEHLFDIGSYGYTIDATKKGNVGRFINHSCSPNLYAQNVLYDHDNKRMAHVMFFTLMGIFPSQELTYDYDNYKLHQGRDGKGDSRKKKVCHCGSKRCRGSFDFK